jgi:hypothetical protein
VVVTKPRCSLLVLVILAGSISQARLTAQSGPTTPDQLIRGVIQQLQTGTQNPTWYSQQLLMLMGLATNYTGVYQALKQLGPVKSVAVTLELPLPLGRAWAMTVQHNIGISYWEVAISAVTNRIEYMDFRDVPGETTVSPPSTVPKEDPGLGKGTTQSEACKRFPNLC